MQDDDLETEVNTEIFNFADDMKLLLVIKYYVNGKKLQRTSQNWAGKKVADGLQCIRVWVMRLKENSLKYAYFIVNNYSLERDTLESLTVFWNHRVDFQWQPKMSTKCQVSSGR